MYPRKNNPLLSNYKRAREEMNKRRNQLFQRYFKNVPKNVSNQNIQTILTGLQSKYNIPSNYLTMRVDDAVLYQVYLHKIIAPLDEEIYEYQKVITSFNDVIKYDQFFSAPINNEGHTVQDMLREDPTDYEYVKIVWRVFYKYYRDQFGERHYENNDIYIVKLLFIRQIQKILAK